MVIADRCRRCHFHLMQACTTYRPPKDFLWPMSKILYSNLNNKVDFLEYFLSKFVHNTESASETSFLSIQIQNITQLSPPLRSHQSYPDYCKWDCSTRLFILYTYCRQPTAELCRTDLMCFLTILCKTVRLRMSTV